MKTALRIYRITDLCLSGELQLLTDFFKLMPFLLPGLRTVLHFFSYTDTLSLECTTGLTETEPES